MTTVERILDLIQSNNITAAKLTQEANLTNGLITQWKKGLQKPSTDALVKIADYFGVSLDYLLGRTEEKNANKKDDASSDVLSEYLEELRTRPEMKMLFNITKKATRADVEKAVKVIEAMLQDE